MYKKIVHKKGQWPTPMLAYYTEPKKEIFNEYKEEFYAKNQIKFNQNFVNKYNHYWNHGAYIILKDNVVISYSFVDFFLFVYLLRLINHDVEIMIENTLFDFIKDDILQFENEIKLQGT